jgi:tRNA (guanine-N(7)-)-methyltransferase subunit TRM82
MQEKVNTIILPTEKTPLTKSSDERFMGTFLLGHSSSVVAICLMSRFLVSADRDEHVRFSVYPETYVIYGMGLGHTAFVSSLLSTSSGVVSGGGDNRVICWDWNGGITGEYKIPQGSCVRGLWGWGDHVFVVGEGYHCF